MCFLCIIFSLMSKNYFEVKNNKLDESLCRSVIKKRMKLNKLFIK